MKVTLNGILCLLTPCYCFSCMSLRPHSSFQGKPLRTFKGWIGLGAKVLFHAGLGLKTRLRFRSRLRRSLGAIMGQPNISKFLKTDKSNETSQISNFSSPEENF